MKKLITFTGSYNNASKTGLLVETIAQKAVNRHPLLVDHYNMNDLGETLGTAQDFFDLEAPAQQLIQAITTADALIVATPVYKGSYPGLFKHFIDLLEPTLFYGKPILLAATGGGTRHSLMIEHQLRPLFGFFMAHSLPTAIYASTDDFSPSNTIITPELLQRIDQAVQEFSPFIAPQYQAANSHALNYFQSQAPDYPLAATAKLKGAY